MDFWTLAVIALVVGGFGYFLYKKLTKKDDVDSEPPHAGQGGRGGKYPR